MNEINYIQTGVRVMMGGRYSELQERGGLSGSDGRESHTGGWPASGGCTEVPVWDPDSV